MHDPAVGSNAAAEHGGKSIDVEAEHMGKSDRCMTVILTRSLFVFVLPEESLTVRSTDYLLFSSEY
jgi:hypothetical protein